MWLLCAKSKREPENLELQMLVQALAELCSHSSYRTMTPEQVYDTIKSHI
jgi:phosphoribosylformylglycinamidine (FGAM) synthase-like enzyme